jgi:hypothetical protein
MEYFDRRGATMKGCDFYHVAVARMTNSQEQKEAPGLVPAIPAHRIDLPARCAATSLSRSITP